MDENEIVLTAKNVNVLIGLVKSGVISDGEGAVEWLNKILYILSPSRITDIDKWESYEYDASMIDAEMSDEEYEAEGWEDKKECFVNFAHERGVNVIETEDGFELIGLRIEEVCQDVQTL